VAAVADGIGQGIQGVKGAHGQIGGQTLDFRGEGCTGDPWQRRLTGGIERGQQDSVGLAQGFGKVP